MTLNLISQEKKVTIDVVNSLTACIRINATNNAELLKPIQFLYVTLSYIDESQKYSWAFKNHMTDAKVFLFNRDYQSFPIGLTAKVYRLLKNQFPDFKIELSTSIFKVFSPPNGKLSVETFNTFVESLNIFNFVTNEKIIPRDYQMKMLYEALNIRRCSLQACTGSGKSLSLYLITRWLYEKENKDVLLIVPSKSLVEQIYSDFKEEYGWEDIDKHCSIVHSEVSELKLNKKKKNALIELNMTRDDLLRRIVITTWQSLAKKTPDFFKRFGGVIVDECHIAKSNSLQTILNLCINADLKVGLSGTIPETGLDGVLVEGSLGDKKIIVKTKELIERGLLTPVQIYSIMIPYDDKSKKIVHRHDHDGQTALCGYNNSRGDVLKLLIDSQKITTKENTLILFKYIKTLELAKEYINTLHPEFKCIIYDGSVSAKDREKIRKQLNEDSGYMIFATYGTIKQGINAPRIHNIVFGDSSKSLITVIQTIGRGVRKYADKVLLKVFDVVDDCSYWTKPRSGGFPSLKLNFAMHHHEKRKEYYAYEEFPVIQIVAPMLATVDVDLTNKIKETPIMDRATKRETENNALEEYKKSKAGFFDEF